MAQAFDVLLLFFVSLAFAFLPGTGFRGIVLLIDDYKDHRHFTFEQARSLGLGFKTIRLIGWAIPEIRLRY